jgi:hypothetical protein
MPLNFLIAPQAIAFDIRDYPTAAMTFWEHVLGVPVLMWVVKTKAQFALADRDARNILFEHLHPPIPRR